MRKCKILAFNGDVGIKTENGTYTGLLGLMQQRKADLYLKGLTDHDVDEPWLLKSATIESEIISFGHSIFDKNDVSYFDLINNFNVGLKLLSIYLAALLIIVIFGLIINEVNFNVRSSKGVSRRRRMIKRRKSFFKKILTTFRSFNQTNKFTPICLFFIFLHMFFWFTQLFLVNNIKTNKVSNTKTLEGFN